MANKNWFSRMFGRKKRLEDLDTEDLRRQELRLRREEKKLAQKVDDHERCKASIFEEAVGKDSKRQKMMLARKIKEMDAAAKHDEKLLQAISTQLRVVSGIRMLKEGKAFRSRFQMLDVLRDMEVSELAIRIEELALDGEVTDERLSQMVATLEEHTNLAVAPEEADIAEIVAAMEAAATASTAGEEDAAGEGMERVNRILERGADEAQEVEASEAV